MYIKMQILSINTSSTQLREDNFFKLLLIIFKLLINTAKKLWIKPISLDKLLILIIRSTLLTFKWIQYFASFCKKFTIFINTHHHLFQIKLWTLFCCCSGTRICRVRAMNLRRIIVFLIYEERKLKFIASFNI